MTFDEEAKNLKQKKEELAKRGPSLIARLNELGEKKRVPQVGIAYADRFCQTFLAPSITMAALNDIKFSAKASGVVTADDWGHLADTRTERGIACLKKNEATFEVAANMIGDTLRDLNGDDTRIIRPLFDALVGDWLFVDLWHKWLELRALLEKEVQKIEDEEKPLQEQLDKISLEIAKSEAAIKAMRSD
jgi:hypothetical protein